MRTVRMGLCVLFALAGVVLTSMTIIAAIKNQEVLLPIAAEICCFVTYFLDKGDNGQ